MDLVWGLSAAIALYAAAHVPKLAGERRARLAVLWEKTLTDAEHPPSRGARASYLWRRLYVTGLGIVALWMLVSYAGLIAVQCGWVVLPWEVGR